MRKGMLVASLAASVCSLSAQAEMVSLSATRDATIYESTTGEVANGAGQYLFAGRTNQNLARRALVHFDIASAIPDGATITSARLILNISQANGGVRDVFLHRAAALWTTGASNPDGTESLGATPELGDTTWTYASYGPPGAGQWKAAGGDYIPFWSAVTATTTSGLQTWQSIGLTNDVRAFAEDASLNLGWFLLGDESVAGTSRRFDSADSAAFGGIVPRLEIEFEPVPAPGAVALLVLAGFVSRRRR